MKFNKIACVDYTKMNDEAIAQLQEYSEEKIIHPDDFNADHRRNYSKKS